MSRTVEKSAESGRVSSVEKVASELLIGGKVGSLEKAAEFLRDEAAVTPPAPSEGASAADAAPPPADEDASAQRKTSRFVEFNFEQMRSAGLVTSDADGIQVTEEFRLIKRPLLLKAFDKGPDAIPNGNVIMVASSRPGEGKTFCAVSLAMSIALERDLTVLLIDADVLKPDIANVLGFEAELGLVDLIADKTLDIPDVMLRTSVENLTILPAGRAHHLSTELLASERMESIVRDIAKRYRDRVIIVDSPPVLMSSIAGVLALHVGQILFVVEAERTAQSSLDSALALVNSCKNISLLLNKARANSGSEKFGAYYGY